MITAIQGALGVAAVPVEQGDIDGQVLHLGHRLGVPALRGDQRRARPAIGCPAHGGEPVG
ncbi:hypothetical protein [Thermoactinospora rubra]|uniref:hypothetical protein n=1 Tax=Thermoactinospora rubra TaxID=1088767 RepID=UPI001301F11D|nr:hypothetical protein [Thermoactinospora rubra]